MTPGGGRGGDLDRWFADPVIRIHHRREAEVGADAVWAAARGVRLRDSGLLGHVVRWRVPGLAPDLRYWDLFRRAPFVVLEEGERHLLSGVAGRIWTVRRSLAPLRDATEFARWAEPGTVRVLFAHWVEPLDGGGAALVSEVRVDPVDPRARSLLARVRPLVRATQHLIGAEALAVAVARAERGEASPAG